MARVTRLAVLLGGTHVADVERLGSSTLRLRMTRQASVPGTTPLSLSMPPHLGSFSGEVVETYLWSLLPENSAALDAVARTYGADVRDPLSLLAAIGKDCAGAVQFCTPDEIDSVMAREGGLVPVSTTDLEMRLAALAMDEDASWTMPHEHWSLGGTQQKFALRRQAEMWFEARGSEPTTHIIKPGIRILKAQALVEHASMTVARRLGLSAAETQFESFNTEDAIVVERFDRVPEPAGTIRRLHQEDLCQAHGLSEKYEEHGGPSALDIIRLLRDASPTARRARTNVETFLDGLVYNTVIGAPDAHARNYAVLLDGDDVRLAPLYDVASGLAYGSTPGGERVVSMSIGGTFVLGEIDTDAWKRFAEQAGVDDAELLDRVRSYAEQVPDMFGDVLDDVDDWDGAASEVRARLVPELRAHTREVLRGLDAHGAAAPARPSEPDDAAARADGMYWRAPHERNGHRVAGHWVRRPQPR